MKWSRTAPSNIALIKYMGKTDSNLNLPTNPSLSYTLPNLISQVSLYQSDAGKDCWMPFEDDESPIELAEAAQQRYLNHLQKIKQHFNFVGNFEIRSRNNFPHGCGIASSASSFAALTLCAMEALSDITQRTLPPIQLQAMVSRLGSGSSCRSFFSPWALWHENHVGQLKLPYQDLQHQVIIISRQPKAVSSSQAHKMVMSSPAFEGRPKRASKRLDQLISAFTNQDWPGAFKIVWDEFMDMHHLFQTAETSFDYMNKDCLQMLEHLRQFWGKYDNGPLITLDAGPNIHLLYRQQDSALKDEFERDFLTGKYDVL